ncbi:MAG: triosephosphate isomerase, partial [Clostridia bacterium]|nr:triosephosphate isomerase [Clostridia bacterium]
KIIIAYEPIWAIGTGKTASKEQAEDMCSHIRYNVAKMYGLNVADNVRIQYGGSVNESNAKELFEMPNIDGALVGGASLKPTFTNIIKAAR